MFSTVQCGQRFLNLADYFEVLKPLTQRHIDGCIRPTIVDELKTGEKSVKRCGVAIELLAITQLAEAAEVLVFHNRVVAVGNLLIENKIELPQLFGDGCSLADFAVGVIDAHMNIRRWNDVFSD
ncbi:hypothetical protein HMPREF2651_07730 [Corynebacterium sp. HMSC063A05]|nr:hypothetical protein HMPREF2651_07730 [Corynebacterium sp. HMSC063A05]OFN08711.1 hypothetical protein HMPREF2614_04955 [Corynebacterium sp. HMSC074C11]OFR92489.1 hypothetical protein HMPREF2860_03005 [Corynebacterium sp. HMSC064E10]OFU54067.1 hypothetical protein HMPREF3122_09815 [Corynebacterium sp. HMSC11H10]OHR36299.1 hypothetical protein HMPREF3011_04390 [Corynebacterium sp. HMSC074C04]